MSKSNSIEPADYAKFFAGLKERIGNAQITAVQAVNRELILLYWDSREAAAACSRRRQPAVGADFTTLAAKRRQQP